MIYAEEHEEKVREQNPGVSLAQIGGILGERYRALSKEERAPYKRRLSMKISSLKNFRGTTRIDGIRKVLVNVE
jgi:hypothetical protein